MTMSIRIQLENQMFVQLSLDFWAQNFDPEMASELKVEFPNLV